MVSDFIRTLQEPLLLTVTFATPVGSYVEKKIPLICSDKVFLTVRCGKISDVCRAGSFSELTGTGRDVGRRGNVCRRL
jgi:hypothetical protein